MTSPETRQAIDIDGARGLQLLGSGAWSNVAGKTFAGFQTKVKVHPVCKIVRPLTFVPNFEFLGRNFRRIKPFGRKPLVLPLNHDGDGHSRNSPAADP